MYFSKNQNRLMGRGDESFLQNTKGAKWPALLATIVALSVNIELTVAYTNRMVFSWTEASASIYFQTY